MPVVENFCQVYLKKRPIVVLGQMRQLVNIENEPVTHVIFMRYFNTYKLSNSNWIVYENNLYKVLRAEDYNFEHTFIALFSCYRGDKNTKSSWA
jgi:hypothetical protein